MEIIYKKVQELIPYVNNSRTHSEEQVNQICASINEFGFTNPLLVDEKDSIIAGHGRLLASKKLGMEEVPCIVLEGLTEAQKKAYIIADNKMALNAGWDEELLKIELENLKELDFDLGLTGFNVDELDDILGNNEETEIVEDNFEAELPEEPKAKLGDIYQLGNHRLMCGDSTSEEDVAKLMNGVKADMVFTDPPYGVKYEARTGIRSKKIRPEMQMILNDDLEGAELQNFINVVIYNLKLFTKSSAPFYVCNNWHCFETFVESFKINKLKLNAFIIWNKDWMSVGHSDYRSNHEFIFYSKRDGDFYAPKGTENDVWTIRKLSPDKKVHTTEKPVEVSGRAIKNSSKKEDIVLDLFGGSGSTLIASEQLGRHCYTMELDPKYVDVIIQRWENFTGEKAVLLNREEKN